MLRRPLPLRPGDPVAVIAPASPPRDVDRYDRGLAALRATYDVRHEWVASAPRGYLAASDEARAQALNAAIADPGIRGIFCVRGGYGCLRLLDRIDYAAARDHPTLLVGYSDITALQWALARHAGWASLSGPVVTEWATADGDTLASFRALAEGRRVPLTGPDEAPLQSMATGTATGPLLPGNLSVLTRLLGTPHCPDLTGAILVLEDVAEAPYRVDRMLAHLRLAGVLEAVAGVVVGTLSGEAPEGQPSLSMHEVVDDYFGDASLPVATGLSYGHQLPRRIVPIGVPARLTVTPDTASLGMLEPVVHVEA